MNKAEEWEWIRRFADRLVALRPALWLTTATAIALMSLPRYRTMEPETAAERYLHDEASE